MFAAAAGARAYGWTWRDRSGGMLRALQLQDNALYILLFILVLIATLNITGLSLTTDEAAVFRLIARGKNRIEMARELKVTTDAITQIWQAVMVQTAGSLLESWIDNMMWSLVGPLSRVIVLDVAPMPGPLNSLDQPLVASQVRYLKSLWPLWP